MRLGFCKDIMLPFFLVGCFGKGELSKTVSTQAGIISVRDLDNFRMLVTESKRRGSGIKSLDQKVLKKAIRSEILSSRALVSRGDSREKGKVFKVGVDVTTYFVGDQNALESENNAKVSQDMDDQSLMYVCSYEFYLVPSLGGIANSMMYGQFLRDAAHLRSMSLVPLYGELRAIEGFTHLDDYGLMCQKESADVFDSKAAKALQEKISQITFQVSSILCESEISYPDDFRHQQCSKWFLGLSPTLRSGARPVCHPFSMTSRTGVCELRAESGAYAPFLPSRFNSNPDGFINKVDALKDPFVTKVFLCDGEISEEVYLRESGSYVVICED